VALLVAPASLVLPSRPFACRIERYLSELLARSWYSWSGTSLILNHSSGGLADFRWSYSSPSDGLSGPENAVRGVNVWSSRLTHVYFDCLAATATPPRPRPLPLAGAAAAAGAGTPWPLPLPRPLPPPLVAGAGAGATLSQPSCRTLSLPVIQRHFHQPGPLTQPPPRPPVQRPGPPPHPTRCLGRCPCQQCLCRPAVHVSPRLGLASLRRIGSHRVWRAANRSLSIRSCSPRSEGMGRGYCAPELCLDAA
jgi:hypothetical protein